MVQRTSCLRLQVTLALFCRPRNRSLSQQPAPSAPHRGHPFAPWRHGRRGPPWRQGASAPRARLEPPQDPGALGARRTSPRRSTPGPVPLRAAAPPGPPGTEPAGEQQRQQTVLRQQSQAGLHVDRGATAAFIAAQSATREKMISAMEALRPMPPLSFPLWRPPSLISHPQKSLRGVLDPELSPESFYRRHLLLRASKKRFLEGLFRAGAPPRIL